MDKEMAQFQSDLLESVRQMNKGKAAALIAPDNLPMTDEQLAVWESSRDLAKELEQSVLEMLAGEGKAIAIKRLVP
jgi:hypothetical protein